MTKRNLETAASRAIRAVLRDDAVGFVTALNTLSNNELEALKRAAFTLVVEVGKMRRAGR